MLDPEGVLRVKQELDSSTNGLSAAVVVSIAANERKRKDSANHTDQIPVNRPLKRRAPNVIYVLSDDDAPLSQPRRAAKSARTGERGRSVTAGAADRPADVLGKHPSMR